MNYEKDCYQNQNKFEQTTNEYHINLYNSNHIQENKSSPRLNINSNLKSNRSKKSTDRSSQKVYENLDTFKNNDHDDIDINSIKKQQNHIDN